MTKRLRLPTRVKSNVNILFLSLLIQNQSSENDIENILYLMADANPDISDIEVFDIDSDEFRHAELDNKIHDKEYSKLSQSFDKFKTENQGLIDQIVKSTCL